MSHQLALITSLPFVHTARRSYRLNGPVRTSDHACDVGSPATYAREVVQTLPFRGRRSRNKVSVGEPAEGSLTCFLYFSVKRKYEKLSKTLPNANMFITFYLFSDWFQRNKPKLNPLFNRGWIYVYLLYMCEISLLKQFWKTFSIESIYPSQGDTDMRNNKSDDFQRWISRLVYRWRTLRTAIRNVNCTTQWIIEILNAYCAAKVISEHAWSSVYSNITTIKI